MTYTYHEKEWLEQVYTHTNGRCFIARDLPQHLKKSGNTVKNYQVKETNYVLKDIIKL